MENLVVFQFMVFFSRVVLHIRVGSRRNFPASLQSFAGYFHCLTSQVTCMSRRWCLSGPTTIHFSQNSGYFNTYRKRCFSIVKKKCKGNVQILFFVSPIFHAKLRAMVRAECRNKFFHGIFRWNKEQFFLKFHCLNNNSHYFTRALGQEILLDIQQ